MFEEEEEEAITNHDQVENEAFDTETMAAKISDPAIVAAIAFVELCLQQTAYIAGRGDIKKDIDLIKSSKFTKFYTI